MASTSTTASAGSTVKTVLVQYEQFNRVVKIDCSPENLQGSTERQLLIRDVRKAFEERIGSDERITLQVKRKEWDGIFVDYFENELEDKSVMRLIVEKVF